LRQKYGTVHPSKPYFLAQKQGSGRQTDGQTQTDGRTDGRTDRQTDRRADGQTHPDTDVQADRRKDGRTDTQTDGRRDGRTDGQAGRQADRQTDRPVQELTTKFSVTCGRILNAWLTFVEPLVALTLHCQSLTAVHKTFVCYFDGQEF
jgi:hypothetical protein